MIIGDLSEVFFYIFMENSQRNFERFDRWVYFSGVVQRSLRFKGGDTINSIDVPPHH